MTIERLPELPLLVLIPICCASILGPVTQQNQMIPLLLSLPCCKDTTIKRNYLNNFVNYFTIEVVICARYRAPQPAGKIFKWVISVIFRYNSSPYVILIYFNHILLSDFWYYFWHRTKILLRNHLRKANVQH